MGEVGVTEVETPDVEREIVADMARRAVYAAPVALLIGTVGWGGRGALSVAYALAIVLLNFALSAVTLSRAAKAGPTALMAAALGGFLVRMVLVAVAIALVNDAGWISRLPLGLTIVGTHLGLLIWEAKYVSGSLAFPALTPRGDA
jgi:hypothetical protein